MNFTIDDNVNDMQTTFDHWDDEGLQSDPAIHNCIHDIVLYIL